MPTRTSSSTASPLTSRRPPSGRRLRCPPGRRSGAGRHRWLRSHPDSEHYGRADGGGPVDLDAYVAEHSHEWRRLELLCRPPPARPPTRSTRWSSLYQRTATHLSACAAGHPIRPWWPALPAGAAGPRRGHRPPSASSWAALGRFFAVGFPGAVYRAWPWWCAVATGFSLLSGFLIWYVAGNPGTAAAFIGPDATDRPGRPRLRRLLHRVLRRRTSPSHVWTNNAWIAAQCLASAACSSCRCSTCCGRTR